MEKSYPFNRDALFAHIAQWQRAQKRDRYPSSYRALGKHVGVSHTYFHHLKKGHDGKRPVNRMNYETALKFSDALDIPMVILLPEAFTVPSNTNTRSESDRKKAA